MLPEARSQSWSPNDKRGYRLCRLDSLAAKILSYNSPHTLYLVAALRRFLHYNREVALCITNSFSHNAGDIDVWLLIILSRLPFVMQRIPYRSKRRCMSI